jgi:hypothetical protein
VKRFLSQTRAAFAALLTAWVWVAVHETGHAVAGALTGASLVDIHLLSLRPHVTLGGAGTPSEQALRALGGSALVLLAWLAIMLFSRRRLRIARQAGSFFASLELLGWLLSALFCRFPIEPNDATEFLAASGLNPAIVAAACLALASAGLWFYLSGRPAAAPAPAPAAASS